MKPRDLLDDLATFAHRFPGWCRSDGIPLSYRHYVYGTQYLVRWDARELLQRASAHHVGGATDEGFKAWRRDMLRVL